MKRNISLRLIRLCNSCHNFSTKCMLSSNNISIVQNLRFEKAKNFLMKKKPENSLYYLEKLIYVNFVNLYSNDKNFYNIKVIDDIITNESTHLVAEFKDYLIDGDDSEFLQHYYPVSKSYKYLPKIFEYYQSCSVIFPNYVILPESKYIYKNIQKKQIVIDVQQEQEEKANKIKKGIIKIENDDNLFTSKIIYSILDQTDTSNIRDFFGIKKIMSDDNSNTPFDIFNMIEKEEEGAELKRKIALKKKEKKEKTINNNSIHNKSDAHLKINKDNLKIYMDNNNNNKKHKKNTISKNNEFNNNSKSKSKSKSKHKNKSKKAIYEFDKNKIITRNTTNNFYKNNKSLKNDLNINYFKNYMNKNTNTNTNNNNVMRPYSLLSRNNATNSNIRINPNHNINHKKINTNTNTNINSFNKDNKHKKKVYNQFQTKKLIQNLLFNFSKPKQSNKLYNSNLKMKNTNEKYKNKKDNFSFSLSPSFSSIKIKHKNKRNIQNLITNKINNSNSSTNLNKKKKRMSKSKEKIERANTYKNDSLFKTIPIKINNNFDVYMPSTSNHSEIEITKDTKNNNYCTIVPQVLNMLNLNIYKINSTNKSQIYTQRNKNKSKIKKILSQRKLNTKSSTNTQKKHIKNLFDQKNDLKNIKTNKKKKKIFALNKMFIDINSNNDNNYFKNGSLTARQYSSNPNRIEEDNFLKNILFSPSYGNIGFTDIKNDIINKNKNMVIPIRKGGKKVYNIRNNIPLTSRCFLNTSGTRNKKKGNILDKNHFNLRGDILGHSNSIINKVGVCENELYNNNNDTNTICSVKSIGHIFKTKKKAKPYNKPSLQFLITNNK